MKKVLAVLLAVLMLCLTLAACNNNTPSGDDETTPTSAAEPTGAPADDETEGGKYMAMEGGYPFEQYKLPAYSDFTSKEILIMTNAEYTTDPTKFDAMRDVYGLTYKTKLITSDQWQTQFISMFMANESADIVLGGGMPLTMINRGYLYALDELIDFDLPIWQEIKGSIENLWYKNHIYTIASSPSRSDVVYYNKTLFEEMGAKTPDELYAEGNWNWDTFRQTMLDMTVDNDGDGIPEIYGAYVDQGMLLFTAGVDYVTMNKDGTITNNIPSDAMARSVNYYVQLYNDGIYQGTDYHTAFAAGQIAMATIALWQVKNVCGDMFKNETIGYVPYPRDTAADKYYLSEDFMGDIVAANAPNPKASAAFICSKRYNTIVNALDEEIKAENEAMTLSEYVDKYGTSYEFDQFLAEEIYSDKFTPVNKVSYNLQIANKWAGDFWFRPLIGEPWATIAEEISPAIDEHIAALLNAE